MTRRREQREVHAAIATTHRQRCTRFKTRDKGGENRVGVGRTGVLRLSHIY